MPVELIAFAVALIASLSLTVPVRQLALHLGMVDQPGPRKVHVTPIPLLGGMAIYFGVVLALVATNPGPTWKQIVGILIAATMLAVVGFLDDGKLLHHQVKLFGAMPAAALILLASGIHAEVFSEFWHGQGGIFLDDCLTIVWVVGITAAFSILDHMDGLCVGIAAVAAAFFVVLALMSQQVLVSTLAAATLGAALGFLRWNFKPAKIFMGDGGAMFLGFLMATLGLKLRLPQISYSADWLIPIFVLGVPILDTTLVSISRARRGLLPFTSPGKDHTAHRLANIGLGQKGAVLALYGEGCLFGVLALIVRYVPGPQDYVLAAGVALAGLVAVFVLERCPYERQQNVDNDASTFPRK